IQSLYEQLAYYVDAQQLGIDGVATLLDSTRDSSDQAARELVHARRLRCAATRRKCLLWALFVVVVVVILWFLFFLH
ncbi:putative transmembrane protein, partial [Toxoplasma gondii RUB]